MPLGNKKRRRVEFNEIHQEGVRRTNFNMNEIGEVISVNKIGRNLNMLKKQLFIILTVMILSFMTACSGGNHRLFAGFDFWVADFLPDFVQVFYPDQTDGIKGEKKSDNLLAFWQFGGT